MLLTGCGPTHNEPDQTIPTNTGNSEEKPDNTETLATTEGTQTSESTQATENTQETDDSAVASLASLRQALVGTPQQFAVAYFGYALPDGNNAADPYAVMEGAAPQLRDDFPFLLQIPEQNILGTDGHLFCIVPTDENATVPLCGYTVGRRNPSHAVQLGNGRHAHGQLWVVSPGIVKSKSGAHINLPL